VAPPHRADGPSGRAYRGARLALVLTLWGATAAAQVPGDANCDGVTDGADLPALTHELFTAADQRCPGADANADGTVTAADATALVARVTQGPRITFVGLVGSNGVPSQAGRPARRPCASATAVRASAGR
jgi:hypothetical protein